MNELHRKRGSCSSHLAIAHTPRASKPAERHQLDTFARQRRHGPAAIAQLNLNLVALGGAAPAYAAGHDPSAAFAATVFFAGVAIGMGGLFVTQRVQAPPAREIMRPSLKKPLLVCRAENVEGTEAVAMRDSARYYAQVA